MSYAAQRSVLQFSTTKGPARCVLFVLAFRCNSVGIAWPKLDTIAADSGLAKSTVQKALKSILEGQPPELLLDGIHRTGTKIYRLNLPRVDLENGAGTEPAGVPGDGTPGYRETVPSIPGDGTQGTGRRYPVHTTGKGNLNRVVRAQQIGLFDLDYEEIMEAPDAVLTALIVGRDAHKPNAPAAEGFYRKAHKALGREKFLDVVSQVAAEAGVDDIKNPGAIHTNKLKEWMGVCFDS